MKIVFVLMCLISCLSLVYGDVVNIDMTNNGTIGPAGSDMPGVLGDQTSATWNTYGSTDLAAGVKSSLVDEDGNATLVTFKSNAPATTVGSSPVNSFSGAGTGFFRTYHFISNGGNPGTPASSSLVIGGLNTALAYDIVLYSTWQWIDAGSTFTIGAVSKTATGVPSESDAAFAEGQSYVKFTDIVPDGNGEISIDWDTYAGAGAHRGPFNAIQIESKGGPSNPDPADNAKGVSSSKDLSWDAAKDPITDLRRTDIVSHYLHMVEQELGQDPNWVHAVTSTIADGGSDPVTALNASLPLTLVANKQYYWRVEEGLDSGGGVAYGIGDPNNIVGPVWAFDTSTLPEILTQPVNVAAFESEDPNFICEFKSLSPLVSVDWNGVDVTADVEDLGGGNYRSVYQFFDVDANDEDTYTCTIDNGAGPPVPSDSVDLLIKRKTAHWEFEGDFTDTLGNFNLDNSDPNLYPGFTTGLLSAGQAIDPNGSSQFLDVTPSEPLNYFAGYTMTLWTQTDNVNQSYTGILGTGSGGFQIDVLSNNFRFAAEGASAQNFGPVTADQRVFLAISYDGSEVMLYKDGLAVSDPISLNQSHQTINVIQVAVNRGNNIYYDGIIDDVQMYNYALTQAEIVDILYAETGTAVCDPALQNFYDVTGPGGEPDCEVNLYDFAAFAAQWLDCVLLPAAECL